MEKAPEPEQGNTPRPGTKKYRRGRSEWAVPTAGFRGRKKRDFRGLRHGSGSLVLRFQLLNRMPSHRLGSNDIVHQFLDGEAIVIDFKRGDYFSLRGAAGAAFDALAQGVDSARLPGLFAGAPPDAGEVLARLAGQWVEAGLLAVADGTVADAAALPAPVAWTEPCCEVHTDLQQLLLADPIHDVGEGAWPRKAEPSL